MPLHILLALTSELYHAVNIYFLFCSYRMFLTNYNERRSIIYHVIFMILFCILRAIRAFIRACAVAPEQIGRKVTKKNRHSQGKCRKNVKIFSNFHKKRGLAGEYDVYSGIFEVCCPPHLSDYEGEEHKEDCGIAGEPRR